MATIHPFRALRPRPEDASRIAAVPYDVVTTDEARAQAVGDAPLFDFDAADGVRHTLWIVRGSARDALVTAFAAIPSLYIADGHHRAASAARARHDIRDRAITRSSLGDDADYTTFLG